MTTISGFKLFALSTVDSTNNYTATATFQSNLPQKAVIMAEYQSKGKGQLGNRWESANGKNLLFSIFMKIDLPVKNQFLINCATSLAIKDTIEYFADTTAFIKWPNDIFVNDKKMAGILIENSIFGSKINRTIIGIGININQTTFKTGDYFSLKLIEKKSFNRQRILAFLLYRFDLYFDQINNSGGELKTLYDRNLLFKNKWKWFNTNENVQFEAKIIGTNGQGKLKLMLRGGEIKTFAHKTIGLL